MGIKLTYIASLDPHNCQQIRNKVIESHSRNDACSTSLLKNFQALKIKMKHPPNAPPVNRLLRKPRVPTVPDIPPPTPPVQHDAQAIIDLAGMTSLLLRL